VFSVISKRNITKVYKYFNKISVKLILSLMLANEFYRWFLKKWNLPTYLMNRLTVLNIIFYKL